MSLCVKMCTTDWNAPPGPSGTDVVVVVVVVVVVAFGLVEVNSLPPLWHCLLVTPILLSLGILGVGFQQ